MRTIAFIIAFFFALFGGGDLARAADNGVVRGTVSYEDRMPVLCIRAPCEAPDRIYPVPNSKVVARHLRDGRKFRTRTDGDGKYRLWLPAGSYLVMTELGEQKAKVKRGKTVNVDFMAIAY